MSPCGAVTGVGGVVERSRFVDVREAPDVVEEFVAPETPVTFDSLLDECVLREPRDPDVCA